MSFNLGSAHGEIVIDYNGAGVQQAMGDLSNLQQTGTNLMRAGAGVAGFGAAIGGALLGATNQAADFQFQMDAVNAALGGLDASQMEVVTQQALDMGAASKFSAGEVAGVQEQLAKSGLSVEQITGGATQAVLDMAAATGEALVPSAAAAAAAVNLFGLDAAQTADVADIFTAGLNASSASLSDFQRGINNLGPVMANLNQYANDGEGAFRDTAAAVAYFNANGLKAADAGVSLARALTNLATPTSKASNLMTELGIEAFDAQGNFIGFPALMDELNQSMSGMSDAQREAALATIFGAEAADVMNQAVKKGGDGLREYTKQVTANGQAAEQARIRQDNLRGALEQLTGSISTAAINIGSTFLGPLQAIVEGITSLINAFNSLPPEVQATIAQFAALAAAMSLLGGGALIAAGAILRFGPMFAAAAAAAAPFLAILLAIGAAIGLGILAYKTDFLGFGRAVDKTLSNAGAAFDRFGKGFKAAFARGNVAGLNRMANGIQAFGDALLYATGIDITGFTDTLAHAVDTFGDALEENLANGVQPLAAGLGALGLVARDLGFTDLADSLVAASHAAQQFGDIFERSLAIGRADGMTGLAAGIQALGDAITDVTGVDVTGVFGRIATAVDALAEAFQRAGDSIGQGFSAALQALTNNILPGAISALGNYFGTLKDIAGAVLSGDFSKAGQIIGDALQSVGQWAGDTAQALGDALGSLDVGAIVGNLAATIGTALGNIAGTVAGFVRGIDWSAVVSAIGTTLSAAFGAAGTFLGGVSSSIAAALRTALDAVGSFLGAVDFAGLVSTVGTALSSAFATAGTWLMGVAQSISSALQEALNEVGGLLGQVDFTSVVSTVGTALSSAFASAGTWLSGVSSGIAASLNAALADVASSLGTPDFAALVSTVGTAIVSAFASAGTWLDGVASSIGAALSAALATISTFMADIDFSALTTTVTDAITNALNAIDLTAAVAGVRTKLEQALASIGEVFTGESAQAGLGGTGTGGGLLQGLADGLVAMVQGAIDDAVEQIGGIDFTAIPTAIKNGIGDALANFGTALFGANEAQAAEGGDTFDAAAFGTQFGDQLAASFESPEFIDAVTASVEAMPAETFSAIGTGILTKIQESITTAMQAAGPGAASETGQGTSPLGADMGAALVTSIATGLQTSVDAAGPEAFALVGTSLLTKVQEALSSAFTRTATGGQAGPVSEDAASGMGLSFVTSMAQSLSNAISAAPVESFAQVGVALTSKIQEVLTQAMSSLGGTAEGGGSFRGGGGDASGMGTQIAQAIASAISGADFAAVATALQTALTTTITTAMTQVTTVITTALTQWTTAFSTGMTTIATAVTTGMTSITTAITAGMASAQAAITAAIAAMTAQFTTFATTATTAGQTAGTGFSTGLTSGLAAAQAAAQAAVAAIIGILNSAADGAYAAGAAVGEGFAAGMEASLGRVQAAAAAMADAAAEGLAAAAQIASPSKVSMAMGQQFGEGFQLGIAGATPNASQASFDLGQDSIRALAESLRSKAEAKAANLRGLGDSIRENQGIATGGGQPMTIETTGSVDLDGEQMGTFTVETVLGGLVGAQRKGGKRRGRMQ